MRGAGRSSRAAAARSRSIALTEGLPAKPLAKAMRGALEKVPAMPEWQDAAFLKRARLARLRRGACAPRTRRRSEADLSPDYAGAQRLAYDELAGQPAGAAADPRAACARQKGRALRGDGRLEGEGDRRPALRADRTRKFRRIGGNRSRHGQRPRACCGCCRAMSARARPSWRCWRC